jgi:Protein of unknown function (DUF3723)
MSYQDSLARKIAESKRANFKGTAVVNLSILSFPYAIRRVDPKLVADLVRNFEESSCFNRDAEYFIPAVIDKETLRNAMTDKGVTTAKLKGAQDIPRLLFRNDFRLKCLHRQHRVHAAKKYFKTPEKQE